MASFSPPLHVAARRFLRESAQYAAARRIGPTTARMWLDREGDRLAERLLDEVWRWTPAEPEVPDLMTALEASLASPSSDLTKEDR